MKRRLLAGAVLAVTLAGALAWSGEVPRWTIGGSQIVGRPPLAAFGPAPLQLPANAHLVLRGDSNALGSRLAAGQQPFGALLAQRLSIEVLAQGGATASDGLALWPPRQRADLCIIAFGSNDAAPRGLLSRREPQPITTFEHALGALIEQCRQSSARVLVLAPWPSGSAAMERRIQPYRLATRRVAMASQVSFRDPAEAFDGASDKPTLLTHDALHLNGAAHRKVADWLAGLLR